MSRGRDLIANIKTWLLGGIAALLIRLIHTTIRWEYIGFPASAPPPASAPVVIAFWHGRMLMMPMIYRRARGAFPRTIYMLMSQHGDGRLIAFAVRLLSISCVAGSSTRGGLAALLKMCRWIEAGADVGFTPDGPKGPRYECKDGIALVAQRTGAVVLPFSYSTERRWQLSTWDRMIIPKPFSRGVAILGAPISVSQEEDREQARLRIQEALHEITEQADRHWTPL